MNIKVHILYLLTVCENRIKDKFKNIAQAMNINYAMRFSCLETDRPMIMLC